MPMILRGWPAVRELALTFPSIRYAMENRTLQDITVEDLKDFQRGFASRGENEVCNFLRGVGNPHSEIRSQFNLHKAWKIWDDEHKEAWKVWAADPWWLS